MIAAVTRQDLQGIVEGAKNTILERMVQRSFVQSIADNIRVSILQNLHELHAENQLSIRQTQSHHDQINRRLQNLEQDTRTILLLLAKVQENQARAVSQLQKL